MPAEDAAGDLEGFVANDGDALEADAKSAKGVQRAERMLDEQQPLPRPPVLLPVSGKLGFHWHGRQLISG
ncbi:hypothetical protein [Aromatoleum buckelii]|uniref:Uncharacterized protein n=1 Tax=Aromatoleum buckelii TaxID=200254 RepID=A0ABX1N865_9RHOO